MNNRPMTGSKKFPTLDGAAELAPSSAPSRAEVDAEGAGDVVYVYAIAREHISRGSCWEVKHARIPRDVFERYRTKTEDGRPLPMAVQFIREDVEHRDMGIR